MCSLSVRRGHVLERNVRAQAAGQSADPCQGFKCQEVGGTWELGSVRGLSGSTHRNTVLYSTAQMTNTSHPPEERRAAG